MNKCCLHAPVVSSGIYPVSLEVQALQILDKTSLSFDLAYTQPYCLILNLLLANIARVKRSIPSSFKTPQLHRLILQDDNGMDSFFSAAFSHQKHTMITPWDLGNY